MNPKYWLISLVFLSSTNVSVEAAEAPISIAKVAAVYVEESTNSHNDTLVASTSANSIVNSVIKNGFKASKNTSIISAAADQANANINAANSDIYDSARELALASVQYNIALEDEIMAEYKAATAMAASAKAYAVVTDDAARDAENLLVNAEPLAAKFNFSIVPNDKKELKEAADKARGLANDAAAKAKQAEEAAAKTLDQVNLAHESAVKAQAIVSSIKPYVGPVNTQKTADKP